MQYEPLAVEQNVQSYWDEKEIYLKAKEKNKGKEKLYFLDGPPYTSGKVHLGTAWNKSLKDSLLRYKRMQGFDVWDRAGYDMHGLPIEHAVEKKLGIHGKEDILKMGVEAFIKECRTLCVDNMQIMNGVFKSLGVWMDFDNAYQSIKPSFIEGEWYLCKQAHEKGRLYEGLRTMSWCASCASANAKHELEYKEITDSSIYVKLPVVGKEGEFLVVWTTTPWTIPFNLAVMVNPELDYVRAQVGDEVWVVAKSLVDTVIVDVAEKGYTIVEEMKGKDLEGIAYTHPLASEMPHYAALKEKSPKVHTILLSSEYVDDSAGTGLVHCAPGCGPEDYEVGHANGIGPFNELDEHGVYREGCGKFTGLRAKVDDAEFVTALNDAGVLIASKKVKHDYAHCWRCKDPIVFRTTKQWFFRVEDLKEKMVTGNNDVAWMPKAAFNAFDSWLKNLRDNSITKQRFWGCPLPVWRCGSCTEYEVIGSIAELKERAGAVPDDLHKPYIDEVTMPCSKCDGTMQRVPDVLDVWVDAGTNSFTCLDYPQRTDLFEEYFPANYILEGKDQFRGWFNILMTCSMIAFDRVPFENVYVHGFVQDAKGRKMSKSLGNYIVPEEVTSVYGADTLRYFFIANGQPGLDINYNEDDVKVRHRNLRVLWNLHNYVIDMSKTNELGVTRLDLSELKGQLGLEEKYMLSRLHSTVKRVTELYDNYELHAAPNTVEELYLDLSRTYVQLVREKGSTGSEDEKRVVLAVLYEVVLNVLKMLAPVVPFAVEQMYLNLKEHFGLEEESVHLYDWPTCNENMLDVELETQMDTAQGVIASILNAREKAKLGVRWPVARVSVVASREGVAEAVAAMQDMIKVQTNVKELVVVDQCDGVEVKLSADAGAIGKAFGAKTPQVIAKLSAEKGEHVLESMQKDGKYVLKVEGEDVELVEEHVKVERVVPAHLKESESRYATIYLDTTRNDTLDAEGYAREMMRKIQTLRKDSGLEKTDNINLFVKCENDLVEYLSAHKDDIAEKCGCAQLMISSNEGSSHEWTQEGKIKGYAYTLMMNRA